MSENGEIYTASKNFTLPPAVTAWTNCTSGSCYDDGMRVVTFLLRDMPVFIYITLRQFYCWEICFWWYRFLLRGLSLFVERFNVNIFLNECSWYDKLLGPSRRVVTLFINLHTYAWLEIGVNIKQFVSVAVNRRMAAWGPCIILTQHYPANITIFFQKWFKDKYKHQDQHQH